MKILVLATTFPRWKNDTTPAFVYELCQRLSYEGFDITVLAPHHQEAKAKEDMGGVKVYRFPYFYPQKYQRLCYEGGILPNLKRSPWARIQVPLLFLSELYYAFKLTRKERPDIIHSHWIIPSGLVGAVCRKTLGTKHLLTLHGAGLVALEKLPFKKKITRFIVKNSDEITVVSSYVKERLLNLVSRDIKEEVQGKLKIIPMGVYTGLFQSEADRETLKSKYAIRSKFVLLFIGRLADKKGVSYLIKAMPKIVSQNKDVILLICGDGPLRKELEQITDELELQEFVRFIGYVTGENKIDCFALSDSLIIPSVVTESGDTEGLPVVILEGLAAGKPIIASDVGGVKDVIKEGWNGFLIKQRNPDQIAARVLELISNEELRVKFSRNALEASQDYDWAVIGGKYGQIMRDIVAR
jgi:glycosyltransferase involved in cell wall biosynthesis